MTATALRSDFYVYVLFRHDDGTPFYVGKGTGRRWLRSENDRGNAHKSHVVAAAKRAGVEIPKIIVQSGLTKDDALLIEVALIAAIGRKIHGGTLSNATDGGEDPPVRTSPHTAETIAKMKAAAAGRKPSAASVAAMTASRRGKKQSPETIRKRMAHRKGVPHSAAHTKAISDALKGKMPTLKCKQAKAEYDRQRSETLRPLRPCACCKTPFKPKRRTQIYCGYSCSAKSNSNAIAGLKRRWELRDERKNNDRQSC